MEDVKEPVGILAKQGVQACLAKAKDVGGVNPGFDTYLHLSISLQVHKEFMEQLAKAKKEFDNVKKQNH